YFTTRKLLNAPEKNAAFNVERVHDERYLIYFFDKAVGGRELSDPTRTARYELARYLQDHLHPEDRIAVVGHDVRLKVYSDSSGGSKTILHRLAGPLPFALGPRSASAGSAT